MIQTCAELSVNRNVKTHRHEDYHPVSISRYFHIPRDTDFCFFVRVLFLGCSFSPSTGVVVVVSLCVVYVGGTGRALNKMASYSRALAHACRYDIDVSAAKLAVRRGARFSQRSPHRRCTPLFFACLGRESSRVELVRWIVKQPLGKETIDLANIAGWTPLMRAAFNGHSGEERTLASRSGHL